MEVVGTAPRQSIMNSTNLTKVAAAILIAVSVTAARAEDCAHQADAIGAEYDIVTGDTDGGAQTRRIFGFWRIGAIVLHEYPEAGIADAWFRTADGRLKTTRYFDEARRAIEYHPGDLNRGRGLRNWSEKSQLVSQDMIDALRRQTAEFPQPVHEGMRVLTETKHTIGPDNRQCRTIEWLSGQTNGQTLHIGWMPELRIPYWLAVAKDGKTILQWRLKRLVDNGNGEILARQQHRSRFKEIDFGDIGDAETDPFFGGLIHMGFVEHSHSGFYDSDGHAVGGGERDVGHDHDNERHGKSRPR